MIVLKEKLMLLPPPPLPSELPSFFMAMIQQGAGHIPEILFLIDVMALCSRCIFVSAIGMRSGDCGVHFSTANEQLC